MADSDSNSNDNDNDKSVVNLILLHNNEQFTANRDDRLNPRMAAILHEWLKISHQVTVGDGVVVTDDKHSRNGHQAVIVSSLARNRYGLAAIPYMAGVSEVIVFDRSQFRKIHCWCPTCFPRTETSTRAILVCSAFLHGARNEIERIMRSQECINGTVLHQDREETQLYQGDLVTIFKKLSSSSHLSPNSVFQLFMALAIVKSDEVK